MYKSVNEYIRKVNEEISIDIKQIYNTNNIKSIMFISETSGNDSIDINYTNKVETIYGENNIINKLKNIFKI